MKIKNKKGQTFTIIAIFLIVFLFVSVEFFSDIHKRRVIRTRVETMDNFLFSIETNIQRQLYIFGYRTIFLANEQITQTGNYINVESFFNESFFNGSVNGEEKELMIGARYRDIVDSAQSKASKINSNVTFSNTSIKIDQIDPWNIRITLSTYIEMFDLSELAEWRKQENYTIFVPVIGFEDPIYLVNTNSLVSHKINKTIYDGNYINNSDISNLLDHLDKGYYSYESDAPSYLDRLEGNLDPDVNGIESLVDVSKLSLQGIQTYDKSVVDHVYFSLENPLTTGVSGMPSWFKVDIDHKIKYNISG